MSPAIATPSSTIVEFGEHPTLQGSAAERADHIFKLWSARNSKPQLNKDNKELGDDVPDIISPVTPRPSVGLARKLGNKGINDRVSRFLASISQSGAADPDKELAVENRSLHQQLASLRRAEENLMTENQAISIQLAEAKADQVRLERQFEERIKAAEAAFEAKLQEVEEQKELDSNIEELQKKVAKLERRNSKLDKKLIEQDEYIGLLEHKVVEQHKQIVEQDNLIGEQDKHITQLESQVTKLKPAIKPGPEAGLVLSDADISTWFETRTAIWNTWVEDFAHRNPNRIIELHPVQQKELLRGVKNFVRLTSDGQFPSSLLELASKSTNSTSAKNKKAKNLTTLLLYAILTNFITTEALAPPFWAFTALRKTAELSEQLLKAGSDPASMLAGSMSPVGFRMDLASWECIPPLPASQYIPSDNFAHNNMPPPTARSISLMSPRPKAPSVITSLQSAGLETPVGLPTAVPSGLPSEGDVRSMHDFLSRVSSTPSTPSSQSTHWRALTISILASGGLTLDPTHPSISKCEDRRLLAEARREYAVKLVERFLGGPARFLLEDQLGDAKGIAKLEGVLTTEMDSALRFSARLWSGRWEVGVKGLEQISLAGEDKEEGVRVENGGDEDLEDGTGNEKEEGEVVLVLQPAVVRLGTGTTTEGKEDGEKVWSPARVFVAPKEVKEEVVPEATSAVDSAIVMEHEEDDKDLKDVEVVKAEEVQTPSRKGGLSIKV